MTTATLTYRGALVIATCWCGIRHAMPKELWDEAHRVSRETFCPLGHSGIYGDTETDQLRRKLKNAESTAAWERKHREETERSLVATKGHVTRLRKQVLAGECPFCGQHLRDLERHIIRQHKDEPVEAA